MTANGSVERQCRPWLMLARCREAVERGAARGLAAAAEEGREAPERGGGGGGGAGCVVREVLGRPKRYKLARALRWEYSDKRPELAQRLGQPGVALTCGTQRRPQLHRRIHPRNIGGGRAGRGCACLDARNVERRCCRRGGRRQRAGAPDIGPVRVPQRLPGAVARGERAGADLARGGTVILRCHGLPLTAIP
jgi:hypothetical protein